MSPREIIVKALIDCWERFDPVCPSYGDEADLLLKALDEQGMAVVPKSEVSALNRNLADEQAHRDIRGGRT